MTDITFVTYHSENSHPTEEWSAYVLLPNGTRWNVVGFGSTEFEAKAKVGAIYAAELKRRTTYSNDAGWNAIAAKQDMRGAHFANMVWLINVATREKVRKSHAEAEAMLATGDWVRGGPRSK